MADVTKYSVYDPRIVQTKPEYAVEKGALSLTNVSFQAQTADSSSVQFNVQVPSENVFVDRAIEMTGTLVGTVTVTVGAGGLPLGVALDGLIAPAAFPMHQATTQMSATINDATVTVNTQDVLPQVLRLADLREARRQRTCPTMLDKYAKYPDSRTVKNSPLLGWAETKHSDGVPNGGFNGFYFATDASGATPVPISGASGAVGGSPALVQYWNGVPYTVDACPQGTVLVFYVAVTSTEKLLLPPFVFADQHEMSTGLFGVQNFQVQMNITPSSSCRSFRVSSEQTFVAPATGLVLNTPVTFTSFALSSTAGNGCWAGRPTLAVQFLTPALDIPLPPKSIVPYMEFPRYIATPNTAVAQTTNSYTTTALQSQTITLPNIPDLLLIYVKPSSYTSVAQGDWSLPIYSISLNFDNFSGLLSTITQDQLYQMSVRNGLDMDWSEWTGTGNVPLVNDAAGNAPKGGKVGLVGGPLVLRPGRDFALQAGQASGLVGNFTLQFNLQVQNFTGITLDGSSAVQPFVNIYTVPISSGFFETIKGSSRIIKGVLTEQDILAAPMKAPSVELQRPVGAARPPASSAKPSRGSVHSMKSYM